MNIPTDSFADIAFLLIIYFILATTFMTYQGMTTQLPSGEKTKTQTKDEPPTIRLSGDQIHWGKQPVDMPALRGKLKEMDLPAKSDSDRVILLEATANVNWQNYSEALAAIAAAGGVPGISMDEEADQ